LAVVAPLLASISWDPFVRGLLIVLIAILVLPGSVYLVLATNTGVRLGFLLTAAALSGWFVIMGTVWAVFGIGLQGRTPSWHVKEIITGDPSRSTTLKDFPQKFNKLPPGDPRLADAQSAADRFLASAAAGDTSHAGGGTAKAPDFAPPFSQVSDYVQIAGYTYDKTTTWYIRKHKITPFGHDEHIAVIQVQAVVKQPNTGGAPPRPQPDVTKPIVTVVMERDLGSVRQPPIIITAASLVIFGVICYVLHQRDKEIMAARAGAGTAT
jgi:hypothetical protein